MQLLDKISQIDFSKDNGKVTKYECDLFDGIVRTITYDGNMINIDGKILRIVSNPYNTIVRQLGVANANRFKQYVQSKFLSIDKFNSYIINNKQVMTITDKQILTFSDCLDFDLLFDGFNIYRLTNQSKCNQVEHFGLLTDSGIDKKLMLHLKVNKRIWKLNYVNSPKKVYDAILNDIANGCFIDKINPEIISNSPDDYCYAYIPLDFPNDTELDATFSFINQFNGDDKEQLCKWIYNLFNSIDKDRRVLYIHGDAQTGKSVFCNVVADYLRTFNESLVATISNGIRFDRFSLSGIDKVRLLVYSDANDRELFKRSEILNITGGDYIEIASKFKDSLHKKVFCKIIVSSNYPPNVNPKAKHETSRLLYCKIIEKAQHLMTNNEFEYKLRQEFPSFLNYIKENYICN